MPAVGSAHPAHCRLGFPSTDHPSRLSWQRAVCSLSRPFQCSFCGQGSERNCLQASRTGGARFTERSPSLKAQHALASSPSESAIFVFRFPRLFQSRGCKYQDEKENEPVSPAQKRADHCRFLNNITTTAAAVMENNLSWSGAALGHRTTSLPRSLSVGFLSLHFTGMRFVAMVTSKSHGISLPRSAGKQQAQIVMGREDAFLPSMVAFPEQTCAAVSPF